VTGVWQVTRSEETTFVERIALDLLYVERRSALLDASLLAMTPIAVARGARSH
jgi:lipopolysaccharide/colanic/teichoic acid biosynthesis glycosyltransferase